MLSGALSWVLWSLLHAGRGGGVYVAELSKILFAVSVFHLFSKEHKGTYIVHNSSSQQACEVGVRLSSSDWPKVTQI